jgi:hypothetical protein
VLSFFGFNFTLSLVSFQANTLSLSMIISLQAATDLLAQLIVLLLHQMMYELVQLIALFSHQTM